MYAPCETCISLSTPAGIECCTSKLADQSACPTGHVPNDSTIYIYTLGSLTLYGDPKSLVIGSNTLTPGGTPATASGHILSLPTTPTGGGVVEDGVTTALGTPISTVVGTGTGSSSTFCPVQQISDAQTQNAPCSSTHTGTKATNTNTDTNTNTSTNANINSDSSTNVNTIINTGKGTGTATLNTDTNTNASINTGIGNTGTSTNIQTATGVDINTNTGTGTTTGTGTSVSTNANTTNGINTRFNTRTGTGAGTGASTGSNITTNTNRNPAGVLSTYPIAGNSFTGNTTNLVAGTVTLTPSGSSLTSLGHTIAIPTSATSGQIQGNGSLTVLPIPRTTNTPASSSAYTIDGIAFIGNPTDLVAGTATLIPGGPSLTFSSHIIAIPTSASGGQIQVDGTTTSLPDLNTATNTGRGTTGTSTGINTGTNTGTGTDANAGTITGTGVSRTSYIATNVPSGLPWGVMLTTVSSRSYTLTWVGSQINSPATITETGPSTTETTFQTAGGFIWTVPTLPPGFPGPPPGPPPEFPDPIGGGNDPIVPGCIFGCGSPGLGGGGGGGLPCLINCGGGGGGDPNLDPSKPSPSDNEPSNSKSTQSRSSSITSASSCSISTFPSCTKVISVSSSTTITSTSCITITGCSGTATTGVSTASTSSTGVYCSIGCIGCGPASKYKSKRDPPLRIEGRLATPEDYWRDDLATFHGLASLPADYMQDDRWKRGFIPRPSDSDFGHNVDNFIIEQIAPNYPGAKLCPISYQYPDSTALTVAFNAPPNEGNYLPSLRGLEGCTSVVIIGEKGCWISHFWEIPWFTGYTQNTRSGATNFQEKIINPLENGGGVSMSSPFAAGGQTSRIPELADGESVNGAPGYKPEIRILTKADGSGNYVYDTEVGLIVQALTGPGRAFEGCTVTKTPYVPITQDPKFDNAKGKILIQYTNDQQNDMGEQLVCPQQAIYKIWFEREMVSEHTWPAAGDQIAGGTGKKKRQNMACSTTRSSSNTATKINTGGPNTNTGTETNANTNTNTNTTTNTGTNSGFTTSIISSSNTITTGPTRTSGPDTTGTSHSSTSYFCSPFQDPDAGPAPPRCECDGLDGFYPYLSSTSDQSDYNPCGYTTSPTTAPATSVAPFTTTESNGEVVSCASSTYYNYAVETIPTCAGATKVVSTVGSIASVYSESVASSVSAASVASITSASNAAWSSAAAIPSAACWILADDGFGDSTFEVYGINGWAGPGGSNLWKQENGCGIVSGGEFHTNRVSEFEGRPRDTQYAYFGLSFFKGGCVERAVHSAGGPAPGTGSGQIACQHVPSNLNSYQLDAVKRISGPQLKAVQAAAAR